MISGCNKQGLQGFKSQSLERGIRQLCYVQSDADGVFGFSRLPPGRYRVEPFYQGPQNLKFDLNPKSQEFTILDDSVALVSDFQVGDGNFYAYAVHLCLKRK